ncbi:MAG: hypothetical protein R3242_10750 [Akkermansiaceae bacterium]|nr:hypothetical protein [Akkermansiaceae bacterium]
MRRVERVETAFQALEVWKSKWSTEFRVEGAVHAWHHHQRFLTGLAWDLIAAAALLGKQKPKSILMLGLAGGTSFRILRHLLPDCELCAVDIDGEVVELARKHMELDALNIEVAIDDGYCWLARNRRRFDVVIDDIYLAGRTDVFRPQSPVDEALLPRLKRAVSPGGVLAVNLVIGKGHRTMQSLTRRQLRQAYPVVRAIRSPQAMNEVLVAGKSVATLSRLGAASFDHARDRVHWSELTQRKL